MVFESDQADFKYWMGALVQLPLRVAAVYTSGSKSIHVLVRVDARSKEEFDQLRIQAIRLTKVIGADDKAITAVRLSRLPGCTRGGKPQKLLYLNPQPEPIPLIKMPPARDVEKDWLHTARLSQAVMGMRSDLCATGWRTMRGQAHQSLMPSRNSTR